MCISDCNIHVVGNQKNCIMLTDIFFFFFVTGYYRVIYQDVLLDRISYEISKGKSFDEYVVALLLGDIVEGALAGIVGFTDALGFLERVINNAKPSNGYWVSVINAFKKLEALFHNTRHYSNLSVFIA